MNQFLSHAFACIVLVLLAGQIVACSAKKSSSNFQRLARGTTQGPAAGMQIDNPEITSRYTVFGKDYVVYRSAKGFEQTGTASWYGPGFHGRTTANGEKYDMLKVSAAHKNLPFGTVLKVENLENGKVVHVRVNDRGPFHDNRVIDLSRSAAEKIDMLKEGTARVHLSLLTEHKPSRHQPSPAITKKWNTENSSLADTNAQKTLSRQAVLNTFANESPAQKNAPRWVQIGAYSERQYAEAVREEIFILNLAQPQQVRIFVSQEKNAHLKLQIGPFIEETELRRMRDRLKTAGYYDAFVTAP